MSKFFSSLCFFVFFFCYEKTASAQDCTIVHEGKFKYGTAKEEVSVEIKGKDHKELHNKGKYFIKSTIEWLSSCEYNMTMVEVTIPNFPYGPGDVMNVKITKIIDKEIFYTSNVKGVSWEGKLIKVE